MVTLCLMCLCGGKQPTIIQKSGSVGWAVGANGHSPLQNNGYKKNSDAGTAHPTIATIVTFFEVNLLNIVPDVSLWWKATNHNPKGCMGWFLGQVLKFDVS